MTQQTQSETTEAAEPTDADLEHHWIAVLSEYWRQADWDQFSNQQKSRADSFGERLEVAARAGTVHGAFKKLAKGLGMAVPELPTANTDPLVANDTQAMTVLRRETVWLTNKADETVSNYFAAIEADDLSTGFSLTTAPGVGPQVVHTIKNAGYDTVGALQKATREDLESLTTIGESTADSIKQIVAEAGSPPSTEIEDPGVTEPTTTELSDFITTED